MSRVRIPKTVALTLLTLGMMFSSQFCHAQAVIDNLRDRFGLSSEFLLNFHSADFKQLPNVDNCCPRFESGSGSGIGIGLLYDMPISRRWSLSLRADLQQQDATLLAIESADVYDPTLQSLTTADIEHRIASHFTSTGLSALLQLNAVAALRFHSGFRVAHVASVHFDQAEELVSGGFVFKENMLRTRNQHSGDLEGLQEWQTSLVLGASYELALNSTRTWLLAPQLSVQLGLNQVLQSADWKANAFRLGLALKFATPPMIPLDTVQRKPTLKVQPEADLALQTKQREQRSSVETEKGLQNPAATLSQYKLSTKQSGVKEARQALDSIVLTEYRSQHLMPLLNYIFFDEGSSVVPQRYTQLSNVDAERFHPSRISLQEGLGAYHELLNVIAWRMRQYPEAQLKLVGCTADVGVEKGRSDLAKSRAVSIKTYLVDQWSIASSRIRIESRTLPLKPSKTLDSIAAGDAENRRVEMSSSDSRILEPMQQHDTTLACSPDSLFVDIQHQRGPALDSLFVVIEPEEGRKQQWSVPKTSSNEYRLALEPRRISHSDWLQCALVRGQESRTVDSCVRILPIIHHSLEHKKRSGERDSTIDKIRLILFDYDEAGLSAQNKRVLSLVQSFIKSGSRVLVEGWTDELGDERYNLLLSEQRAKQSAVLLKTTTANVVGRGESREFPNNLPEGRFYNRTVSVTIYTPTDVP